MHEFISTNSFSFNYRFSVPKVWIWASECWLRLPHSGPILFKCFNLIVIHISVDDFHKKTSKSIFRTFNSSSKNDEKIVIISAKLGQIKKNVNYWLLFWLGVSYSIILETRAEIMNKVLFFGWNEARNIDFPTFNRFLAFTASLSYGHGAFFKWLSSDRGGSRNRPEMDKNSHIRLILLNFLFFRFGSCLGSRVFGLNLRLRRLDYFFLFPLDQKKSINVHFLKLVPGSRCHDFEISLISNTSWFQMYRVDSSLKKFARRSWVSSTLCGLTGKL